MNLQPPPMKFSISIETDDRTGSVLAAYFQVRKGRRHRVKEFADGAVIADYDLNGFLLGFELLAPCRASIMDEVAKTERVSARSGVKRFMKKAGPRELVPA